MAKQPDFSTINTGRQETGVNTGAVYAAIERGKDTFNAQPMASPDEQRERRKNMKTQGRKGCKLPRINLAFSPDNYEFARIMARATGQSITRFVNLCLQKYKEEHEDLYQQARALAEQLDAEAANLTGQNIEPDTAQESESE
ncbi:MAG: hypothetical protein LUD50_08200 [Clostridia bacterium]|nr:hypothetical protein [Clostridia bacterium]